nr:NADH dehydrogenase subunit 6 [Sagra femorata]
MKMMMVMMMMNLAMFPFMAHPLSMGASLLINTILTSIITSTMNVNSWYSYILFLIMVGGMLILFMYMTSVASNEKFKFSIKITVMIYIIAMISMLTIYNNYVYSMLENLMMTEMTLKLDESIKFSKFMNTPNMTMMMVMISYLLITLIMVVKITNMNKGPMRQTN